MKYEFRWILPTTYVKENDEPILQSRVHDDIGEWVTIPLQLVGYKEYVKAVEKIKGF